MKRGWFCGVIAGVAIATAGMAHAISTPIVSQNADTRLVTVAYTLEADAIVTMEILTNTTVLVDASNYWNVEGDVNKLVTAGSRTITWQPDHAWPAIDAATGFKVRLTAWPANKPPLYMVVNLDAATGKDVRYYASSNAIPGGLLVSSCYRDTKLVMRRIDAKDVTWTMGNKDSGGSVNVTLGNDFWFGVFEVTRGQYYNIQGIYEANGYLGSFWSIRPMQYISYALIREGSASSVQNDDYDYPADPHPDSFLGILRTRTGIAFDLPSEAQWEYGGRAGCAIGHWNTGCGNAENDLCPGRHRYNGGMNQHVDPETGAITYKDDLTAEQMKQPEWGTAISGSYAPSIWGIYDIHGNVHEICLDHYCENHADKGDIIATGGVYKVASGTHTRTVRGGNWQAVPFNNRCVSRSHQTDVYTSGGYAGCRLACTIPTGENVPVSVESESNVETRSVRQALSAAGKLFWSGKGLIITLL